MVWVCVPQCACAPITVTTTFLVLKSSLVCDRSKYDMHGASVFRSDVCPFLCGHGSSTTNVWGKTQLSHFILHLHHQNNITLSSALVLHSPLTLGMAWWITMQICTSWKCAIYTVELLPHCGILLFMQCSCTVRTPEAPVCACPTVKIHRAHPGHMIKLFFVVTEYPLHLWSDQ